MWFSSDLNIRFFKHTTYYWFLFDIIGIVKNSLIFSEKIEPIEFKSNFNSSFVRKNRFKGTIWVAFHAVSRAHFSAFLRFCYYPYLNKNFENVSEKMKMFDPSSHFLRFYVRNKSYLKFLFRQLFWYFQAKLCAILCVSA